MRNGMMNLALSIAARRIVAILPKSKRDLLAQLPSLESPAMKNERGRNCNVQNARRKPLSGSSISSRKRS